MRIFFLLLSILSFSAFAQVDCKDEVLKPNWNLSLCTKGNMAVSSKDSSQLKIVVFNEEREYKIFLTRDHNYDSLEPEKILNNHLHRFIKDQDDSIIKDTVFKHQGCPVIVRLNQTNRGFKLASALLIYKKQCYLFVGISNEDGEIIYNEILDLVHRISFSGEPIISKESLIKREFELHLKSLLKDKKHIKQFKLTLEVVRGATPKDKLEEFDTNIKRAKEMMNSWEETYTMFQERLQLFTTTQLIDVIRVKNVNEIGVLYDYNLTFESDGKEWEIEVEAIELNQKIYLMKFK